MSTGRAIKSCPCRSPILHHSGLSSYQKPGLTDTPSWTSEILSTSVAILSVALLAYLTANMYVAEQHSLIPPS